MTSKPKSVRSTRQARLTDADINAKWKYPPKKIGEMLKAWRVSQGISQVEMAKRLEVARSTLNYWERGEVPIALVICFNVLLDGNSSVSNMWQKRAILAEGALKDITETVREYRRAN